MSRAGIRCGLCAVLAASCGTPDSVPPTVTSDSAGVEIVRNAEPAGGPPAWRLSPEPLIDIGVVDGDSAYQFFNVYAGVRLRDGRLAIANGGSGEIRFFDAAGRYQSSVGGMGEGPGEFRNLQALWRLRDDSLLAYDFGLQRLTLYDAAGARARIIRPEPVDGVEPYVMNVFGDGSLLIMGAPRYDEDGATTGVVRNRVHLLRYDAQGEPVDTLGRFAWGESYRLVEGDDFRMTSLPFARFSSFATTETHLYVGEAASYEIRVHALDGTLDRIIRLDRPNRPVSADDIAAFREERLESAREEGSTAVVERMLSGMPFPETMPAYRRVLTDTRGHLWVEEYPAPGETGARWIIFDEDGRLEAAMDLPPRVTPLFLGEDHMLAHWRDGLDVEHVRLYAIERTPVAGPG